MRHHRCKRYRTPSTGEKIKQNVSQSSGIAANRPVETGVRGRGGPSKFSIFKRRKKTFLARACSPHLTLHFMGRWDLAKTGYWKRMDKVCAWYGFTEETKIGLDIFQNRSLVRNTLKPQSKRKVKFSLLYINIFLFFFGKMDRKLRMEVVRYR